MTHWREKQRLITWVSGQDGSDLAERNTFTSPDYTTAGTLWPLVARLART